MFQYENMRFDYEPYPIGVARPALDASIYGAMVKSFPPIELFEYKKDKGEKYSLSQVNNPSKFRKYVASSPPWSAFQRYIQSADFISSAVEMLKQNGVDLGLPVPGFMERMYLRVRALKRGNPVPHFPRLKSRFEFSAMPITGGNILPHTDHPKKLITMVVPMLADGEWDDRWGGGTSVAWPRDKNKIFNRMNHYLDFDKVERQKTFPFEPNQCLVFIKTSNSWHAVWPMTGNDPKVLRKTLTINIESS
jgi:hypothetical protein